MRIFIFIVKISFFYMLLVGFSFPDSKNKEYYSKAKDYFGYKKDSLERHILNFLLDNIDIHYSEHYEYIDSLGNTINFIDTGLSFNELQSKIQEDIKKRNLLLKNIRTYDNDIITDDFLISTIKRGVELWKKPWNRNLTINELCNYLLPYRIQREPFEDWFKLYSEFFPQFKKDTPEEICDTINGFLSNFFFSSFKFDKSETASYCHSPSDLIFRRQGNCQEMCNLSVYLLRNEGVATTIDFCPAWATSSFSHWWCSFRNSKGKFIPFEGVTGKYNDFIMKREPGKVYRITYEKNPTTLISILEPEDIPVPHLKMSNIIDVTTEYWETSSLSYKIFPEYNIDSIAYISVFNRHQWYPIDWGWIHNRTVTFDSISVGAIYLPIVFKDNKCIPAGFPQLLLADNKFRSLEINKRDLISVTIPEDSKYLIYREGMTYALYYWDNAWVLHDAQKARGKSMFFEKLPSNTVYLLVPEYSQRKERPFTVNRGIIERW